MEWVYDESFLQVRKRHTTIAARQHGVIRNDQLGLTSGAISKRLASGTLHRKYRGVYVYGYPRLSQKGEWLAAVYAGGNGAGLTSLGAGRLWKCSRFKESVIEVVAPKQRRQQAGFRLRSSRTLVPRDIVVHDGIPVTTVARMLVDMARVLKAEQLANVIHEAAFRRRFNLEATREAIARAGGCKALERAIEMYLAGSAGTKSDLEDRFLKLVRAAKLPEPIINTHIHTVEVDCRWGTLCVEVDGPNHERAPTQAADRAKTAILEANGCTVIRFTYLQIDYLPRRVIATLRLALTRRS